MICFLDINVFLDFYCARGGQEHQDAVRTIFDHITTQKITAKTSLHSLCTLFYVLTTQNISATDAKAFIRDIAGTIDIVDGNNQTVLRSIDEGFADFEDGIQARLAYENGCDMIITSNIKDFVHSTVLTYSPCELINQLP